MNDPTDTPTIPRCDHCGEPFEVGCQKTKRYCSDRCCRNAAKARRWRRIKGQRMVARVCEHCQSGFSTSHAHKRYCSDRCTTKAARRRHRARKALRNRDRRDRERTAREHQALPWVRRSIADGRSLIATAVMLNTEGVATPSGHGGWHYQTVRALCVRHGVSWQVERPMVCGRCGHPFMAAMGRGSAGRRYCSAQCARRAKRSIRDKRVRKAGRLHSDALGLLLEVQRHKCANPICRKKLVAGDNASIDHVVPLIRGGSNDMSNLQALCHRCNTIKRDKTMDDLIRCTLTV